MNNTTVELFFPISSNDILSWVLIWIIGSILSLFSLVIVVLSREKLKRIEFVILVSFNITTLTFKLVVLCNFSIAYFFPNMILSCGYTIVFLATIVLGEKLFMVLFYYSLFQVSSISREKLFLKLFDLVHSVRNFLIYELIVFIILIAYTTVYTMIAYFKANQTCPYMIQILKEYTELKFYFGYYLQSTLPVLVYSFANTYLCFIRFVSVRFRKYQSDETIKNNRLEISKFRKNVKLLVKFHILSFILFISALFQNLFYQFSFVYWDFSIRSIIFADVGFILYSIQPLFFIYIHRILKKTFLSYFLDFYDCITKFLKF